MKPTPPTRPLILFDFKKHRIRIHKNTLKALGNPEYVLILVNPDNRLIALQKSDHSNTRSHHISWSAIANKKSFEIYSTSLFEKLKLLSAWDENRTYRIYGNVVDEMEAAQFRIDESFIYTANEA